MKFKKGHSSLAMSRKRMLIDDRSALEHFIVKKDTQNKVHDIHNTTNSSHVSALSELPIPQSKSPTLSVSPSTPFPSPVPKFSSHLEPFPSQILILRKA